jgi:phenylpropionate dioxygenase-like ring-hydroxylating dioxygenase large terminal subunit
MGWTGANMYINFWYPICLSEELSSDRPHPSQVLGLRFVAFRDQQGSPHVLSDTCVHRGGSLSKGKIKDGCIACPYHGWEYAGDGRASLIPSQGPDDKLPARAKVDSYPVREQYGIVFAFLGDLPEDERPPLYEIREFDRNGWRASDALTINVNAYYERSMENGLDLVHNEFVHPLQGNVSAKLDTIEITEIPWGTKVHAYSSQPLPGKTKLSNLRGNPDDLGAGSWHHGPNTLVTSIDLSADNNFTQYFFEAPVNQDLTKIYFVNLRNCMLEPENDDRIRDINLSIANEDIRILEALYPIRTPETTTKEILSTGDESIVRFRNCLKDWQNHGWQMDVKTLRKNAGDVAYAIPCPDRRSSGNWVLDPVPLVPGQ